MRKNAKDKKTPISGYYFITNSALSKNGNFNDVKNAARCGVTAIQYRAKNLETGDMIKEAAALKKICGDALFIVNDRVDVAQAINAKGVHIGQKDMDYKTARKILGKDIIIGVSVTNMKEAKKALKDGADYLGVGPIFRTKTKHDASKPTGTKLIKKIREISDIPIAAIGGITLENAPDVISAGANSICSISAVVSKNNVAKEISKFQRLWSRQLTDNTNS
ncbi:MAG TPA: thiamine phosphate synthase [Candidatus Omnitrophota bacterium]|nr:thiamine phosphate synthase [Candidatus Omnitrophota bacterium]HPS19816.1 thiamine phosphate synthase [Candidatus Omnitrophota bacterium]